MSIQDLEILLRYYLKTKIILKNYTIYNFFQIIGLISQENRSVPFEVVLESFVKEIYISNTDDSNQNYKSISIKQTVLHQVILLMVDMKITTG